MPPCASQGGGWARSSPASVTGVCLRLQVHQQLREELARAKTLEGIAAVSQALKLQCQAGAGLRGPAVVARLSHDQVWAFAGGHVAAGGGSQAHW